jgi:hypothetical protein
MKSKTMKAKVEDFLKEHDGQWVDAKLLMEVGGMFAWRTRVSDCRKLGMFIENRQRSVDGYTCTEYRYTSGGFRLISEDATRRENR